MIPQSIVVCCSGNGSNLEALMHAQTAGFFKIAAVISNEPHAYALSRAKSRGIPTHLIEQSAFENKIQFEDALIDTLQHYEPAIICLAGFMVILSARVVEQFQDRILNIHPSLLPRYKGLNTHERALADKERITGATVHRVTAALDNGPILGQIKVPVLRDDTAESLGARVLFAEHHLYPNVLNNLFKGNHDWPIFYEYDPSEARFHTIVGGLL